jgi:hypothetical protein
MSGSDDAGAIPLPLLAQTLACFVDPAARLTEVTALDIQPGMSGASVRRYTHAKRHEIPVLGRRRPLPDFFEIAAEVHGAAEALPSHGNPARHPPCPQAYRSPFHRRLQAPAVAACRSSPSSGSTYDAGPFCTNSGACARMRLGIHWYPHDARAAWWTIRLTPPGRWSAGRQSGRLCSASASSSG